MQLFSLITGPVGKVLGLILLMSVFGLGLGTMNSWYLQTVDAGVVNNERFDRVVAKGAHSTADEAWEAATAPVLVTKKTGGGCTSGVSTGATFYTPIGTEVSLDSSGDIDGCEWQEESDIFKQAGMGGLIAIVLQAVGLAGPVLLLTEVGTFAGSFARKAGGHPILSIVITLIVLLLVGTMMQTFIPFLDTAFAAIDSKRFLMYDSGLGKLATVISSFLGVVLVAGLLMLGWGLWQNLRGGNLLGGAGQRM